MDQAIIEGVSVKLLDRVGRPQEWHDLAECKGLGTYFYPKVGKVFDERPAKSICARCPVMLECFAHRMKTREPGVWGHVDETEIHKFGGVYNETVLERMNPEELRAYIIRVAAPRKPKQQGRPKRPGKKSTNGPELEQQDGSGVPGGAGDPLEGPLDAAGLGDRLGTAERAAFGGVACGGS